MIGLRAECDAKALARDICSARSSNAGDSIVSHGDVLQASADTTKWRAGQWKHWLGCSIQHSVGRRFESTTAALIAAMCSRHAVFKHSNATCIKHPRTV